MMKWRIIPKHGTNPARSLRGTYRDWKPDLAIEAEHQCVYCALHDSRFGGIYNYHVEHFEPKSKAPHKINEWSNLFYACPVCNVFKGNDWPLPGSPFAYVDPSQVDYETIFDRMPDGRIIGRSKVAQYMAERLYLNRPQLQLERREADLRWRIQQARFVTEELAKILATMKESDIRLLSDLAECIQLKCRIDKLLEDLYAMTPYESTDVRRT